MNIVTLLATVYLIGGDFTICDATDQQYYPCAVYQNNQYYVFWTDARAYPAYALYGARINSAGTVLDPNGKFQYQDSVMEPRAAYDGSNFLVVWREGC